MRFASLQTDFWELGSGEELHARFPDSFEIPPAGQRRSLRRGDSARLLFNIELEGEDGKPMQFGERMWVVVDFVGDGYYLGRLINQPGSFDPEECDFYLGFGAEIPFAPEHVIDLEEPWAEADLDRLIARVPSSCSWGPGT